MVQQNKDFQRIGAQVRTVLSCSKCVCALYIFNFRVTLYIDLDTKTPRPKPRTTALPEEIRTKLGFPGRRNSVLKSCESKENAIKTKGSRK
jgi:hypothetical protein